MLRLVLLFSIRGTVGEFFPVVILGVVVLGLFVFFLVTIALGVINRRRIRQAERAVQEEQGRLQAEEAQRQWEAREEERRERERAEGLRRQRDFLQRLRTEDFLRSLLPLQFEELVLQVFAQEGWVVSRTKASGDEGVDGWLEKDGRRVALQCKHHAKPIGQPAIRDFFGTIVKEGASEGYFVASSSYTQQTTRWVEELNGGPPIRLFDRSHLALLLERHAEALSIHHDEIEFPPSPACENCGKEMILLRRAKDLFWGCSNYPSCRSYRKVTEEQARFVALGAWSIKQLPAKRRPYPHFRR